MKAVAAVSRANVDNIPVIRSATPNSQRAQTVTTDAVATRYFAKTNKQITILKY